ncbi:MAG: DUF3467 domain-containing protein [Methanothrix sp.]
MIESEKKDIVSETTELFDIEKLYKTDQNSIILNISESFYSNYARINVSNRDVNIDFIEMPGVKKEDKIVINAIRIKLPHSVAQNLAGLLIGLLEKAYNGGNMEQYKPLSKPDLINLPSDES